jgi:2-methylcitrate dehydratase PrpD
VSLPYSVAVALIEGNALLAQYSDRKLRQPAIKRLMELTRIETDESLARGVSCHMTIAMAGGEEHVSQIDFPKGSIENPMSDDELRSKFESLAAPVLGEKRAAALAGAVGRVDDCTDVAELMRLASKPRGATQSRKSAKRA